MCLVNNGIELNWFWVSIVQTRSRWVVVFVDLIHLTIVNAYWSIGPLQSLVLKEHQWLLDIQYTPQGIDESLWWFKLVHFNSWFWHLITHGHNATWRCHRDTFKVSGLNSNNWTVYYKTFVIWVILVYESTCVLLMCIDPMLHVCSVPFTCSNQKGMELCRDS